MGQYCTRIGFVSLVEEPVIGSIPINRLQKAESMPWLETPSTGVFQIVMRHGDRKYKQSLRTKSQVEADAQLARVKFNLHLCEMGRMEIPNNIHPLEFLLADGKVDDSSPESPVAYTFDKLVAEFFASIPERSLEKTTLDAMRLHCRHLQRHFKNNFLVQTLTTEHLQAYVNHRAGMRSQFKRPISANTIHKELVTFGTMWRWAARCKKVDGMFPRKGVRLPKKQESPPFQTIDEIETQIRLGNLGKDDQDSLWDALYLRRSDIDDVLDHVKETASYGFIYPLFVMAAHTGARRSEMLRSQRIDFDFQNEVVTIREKKRVHGTMTTRRVPMSPLLASVMKAWFTQHPNSIHTFSPEPSQTDPPGHCREPITKDQAHDHFKRTLVKQQVEQNPRLALLPPQLHQQPGLRSRRPTNHRRIRRPHNRANAPEIPPPVPKREKRSVAASVWLANRFRWQQLKRKMAANSSVADWRELDFHHLAQLHAVLATSAPKRNHSEPAVGPTDRS